jgi:hypothetical protein
LPEPVPALIGEDLATFKAHDAAWLAQDTRQEHAPVDIDVIAPRMEGTTATASARSSDPLRWPTAALRPNPLNPRGQLFPLTSSDWRTPSSRTRRTAAYCNRC